MRGVGVAGAAVVSGGADGDVEAVPHAAARRAAPPRRTSRALGADLRVTMMFGSSSCEIYVDLHLMSRSV
jgi:hypothetical protein